MTKERVGAGFQVGFHAIGDKGVQMALRAFDEAQKEAREKKIKAANGGNDYRLRIEHAQVTTPLQIAKFKELKVIASTQPNHLLTDMNWALDRLGPKRAAHSYAWAECRWPLERIIRSNRSPHSAACMLLSLAEARTTSANIFPNRK